MSKLDLPFEIIKPFYTRHLLLGELLLGDVSLVILRLAFFLKREEAFTAYHARQLNDTSVEINEACMVLLCRLEDRGVNGIVLYMMAQYYESLGAKAEANNCYSKAEHVFTTEERHLSGEELFYRGLLCRREKPGHAPLYTEAAMYFQQAVSLGFIEAYACLAAAFQRGEGVEKDSDLALTYYEKGVTANSVRAILHLASLCHYTIGRYRDIIRAKELYLKAASMGSCYAQERYLSLVGEDT